MQRIKNITIGADPELFIYDKKNKKVISSIGIIPGEKGDPWKDESWPEGFGLEIDNILAEFNIPPVTNKEDFIKNMNFMKNYISDFVKKINPNYDILCVASKMVDEDQLQHPEAKMFGCSPDYNVYTQGPNPKPNGELTCLRSAGCHIHIGYENKTVETSLQLIKLFDLFVGLLGVVYDKDRKRRSLYGKAGCFRLTSYGFEARILSAKMYDTDEIMSLVWDGIEATITSYNKGLALDPDMEKLVIKAINTSNKKLAIEILNNVLSCNIDNKVNTYIKNVFLIQ